MIDSTLCVEKYDKVFALLEKYMRERVHVECLVRIEHFKG